MKYPPVRLAMPDGVCEWLERELESRGIDAVVYTRYVLSLLHREVHPADLIASVVDNGSIKVSGGTVLRHRRRASRGGGCGQPKIDLDQLRRTAAVDCLASACDQKCGIESLVDELCQRLKDFESDTIEQTRNCPSPRENVAQYDRSATPIDLAAKYYAAFPALGSGERQRHHYVSQRLIDDTQHLQVANFGEPAFLAGDEGYSTNSDHETCDTAVPDLECQDLDLEYEDLPVDIRGLLASPVTPPTSLQRRTQQIPTATQQYRPYIRCGTNITSSIWSQDVEEVVQQQVQTLPLETSRWSDGGDRRIVSFMQLNHGGEASCFAEVPPGALPRQHVLASVQHQVPAPQLPTVDEDLLTSTRTHFRPIKQEVSGSSSTSVATSGGTQAYADGTTFAIRGSLERVPYRRTDSGTLYLQQDTNASPERYLEWRPMDMAALGTAKSFQIPHSDTYSFVLRFRVKQNEKCCQTDENEPTDDEYDNSSVNGRCRTSGEETPPPKKRVLSEPSCCDEDCELYFPGDCELLLHEQWRGAGGCAQCSTSNVWGATCTACAPQVPERRTAHRRDLCRLRDELSREGDQLLSDLQRIVQIPGTAELVPQPQPSITMHPQPDHRKRRHSGAPATVQRISWPIAVVPPAQQLQSLLRPVTL